MSISGLGLGFASSPTPAQLGRPIKRVASLPVTMRAFMSDSESDSEEEVERMLVSVRRKSSSATVEFPMPPHAAVLSPKASIIADIPIEDALSYGWLLPLISAGEPSPIAPSLAKAPSVASMSERSMRRTTSTVSAFSAASVSTAATSAASVMSRKRPVRSASMFFASERDLAFRRGSTASIASSLNSPPLSHKRSPPTTLSAVLEPAEPPRAELVELWAASAAHRRVQQRSVSARPLQRSSSKRAIRKVASWLGIRQDVKRSLADQLNSVKEVAPRRVPSIEQILSSA